jgi:hypothetical protein
MIMNVYLGKDWQSATQMMTVTHVKVKSLNSRVEGDAHKLYMDNVFSSPDLFDGLHTRAINRQNCKGMMGDFYSKALKLERGDIMLG